MDGCNVHFDLRGQLALRAADVYDITRPSLLSHIGRPREGPGFLAFKADGRMHVRVLTSIIPGSAGFDVYNFLLAVASCWRTTTTLDCIMTSFKSCVMLSIDVSRIDLSRLRTVKGTAAANTTYSMTALVVRLKPDAMRQLEEVTWTYVIISSSGKAFLATREGVATAITETRQADADEARKEVEPAAEKKQHTEIRPRQYLITRDRRVRGAIKTVQKWPAGRLSAPAHAHAQSFRCLVRRGGRRRKSTVHPHNSGRVAAVNVQSVCATCLARAYTL